MYLVYNSLHRLNLLTVEQRYGTLHARYPLPTRYPLHPYPLPTHYPLPQFR